jgi:hypothetical protein
LGQFKGSKDSRWTTANDDNIVPFSHFANPAIV